MRNVIVNNQVGFSGVTSKKELVKYLIDTVTNSTTEAKLKKDKNLFSRVKYAFNALKAKTDVPKDVLLEIANEVKALLTPVPVPVENLIKRTPAASKKTEKTEEKPAEKGAKKTLVKKGSSPAPEVADKKKVVKPEPKKIAKIGVVPKEAKNEKIPLAAEFPKVVESNNYGKLTAVDIEDVKELYKAVVDEGRSIVFAFYWNERHLAQFVYDSFGINKKPFKKFENDLDLASVVYASDEGKVAYCVSLNSELSYMIMPEDMKADENGLRFSQGVEFAIYELEQE
jgi:hypothetical protein